MGPIWLIGILMVVVGIGLGIWHMSESIRKYEEEIHPPCVREVKEWGSYGSSLLVRGAAGSEQQFVAAIAQIIAEANLPHVRTVPGELEGVTRHAVFVECIFRETIRMYIIAFLPHGGRDMRISWMETSQKRAQLKKLRWIQTWWILLAIPVATYGAPLMLGYVIGARLQLHHHDLKALSILEVQGAEENDVDIQVFQITVDRAIREAIDQVGFGQDAVISLI
jgi:hypothetical protein